MPTPPVNYRPIVLGCAAALMVVGATGARGSGTSLAECIEGADFIANAAMSRDNGIGRAAFIARLEGDFAAIRAYPVALRWFVKDGDDERFLRAAAEDVFDRPLPPDRHRAAFFAACVGRASA